MKFIMTDNKDMASAAAVEAPTYIVTDGSQKVDGSKKGSITKKHVLFAVTGVLVVALILVAIIVGMYMFTESQKEIVKFSLQFKGSDDENVKQDVESDPNDNVVMYHVNKPGQDAYIVNDFNKGMQFIKMTTSNAGVSCFVATLNSTVAMDPSYIAGPNSGNGMDGNHEESFSISSEPVTDRSFLPKKAKDLCSGISLYWVTKQCTQKLPENGTETGGRVKRAIYKMSTFNGLQGLGGCCKQYYACDLLMVEYVVGSVHICETLYRTGTCCTPNAAYPVAVPYPYCMNVYFGSWKTPGLICPAA